MSRLVWLVHWTGRSVIVCVRNWAVAAAEARDGPIKAYAAWSLAGGRAVRVPLSGLDSGDLSDALATARQRLAALGSKTGANFRQFGDITVYFHLYFAWEHWLGSPLDLREHLAAETRLAEQAHLLNRH